MSNFTNLTNLTNTFFYELNSHIMDDDDGTNTDTSFSRSLGVRIFCIVFSIIISVSLIIILFFLAKFIFEILFPEKQKIDVINLKKIETKENIYEYL